MITKHICPYCQADITDEVEREIKLAFREQRAQAGKTKTEKKTQAAKENIKKAASVANAAYTPEKRAIAAQKRRETMARKKKNL